MNDDSMRKCPCCGKKFTPLLPKQIFCSAKCWREGQRKPEPAPAAPAKPEPKQIPEPKPERAAAPAHAAREILRKPQPTPGSERAEGEPEHTLNARGRRAYPHRYRCGKQTSPLSFQEFESQVEKGKLSLEHEGFMWGLYYLGCRKSELYERVAGDCQLTPEQFIIDIPRKKHGARVPAIKLSRGWKGINKLAALYENALQAKPRSKRIYYQENQKTLSKIVKDSWLFPHIGSSTALRLVRRVLGSGYYPHFLRLNRLTEIGMDPEASIVRLKTFSGIQSIKTLESYLGTSEEEQEKALSWMQKRMTDPASPQNP